MDEFVSGNEPAARAASILRNALSRLLLDNPGPPFQPRTWKDCITLQVPVSCSWRISSAKFKTAVSSFVHYIVSDMYDGQIMLN